MDRPRRASPAGTAVILMLALGFGAWVVLNSAFFEVRDVRVVGARSLSADEIRGLAGIRSGANLILLPLDDVAARVERHPWVLDAQVERDLPTTAVIKVIERRPGGWVEDPNGMAVIAGDGTVLERVSEAPAQLPDIGDSATALGVGERAAIPGETLRVAASMGGPLRRQVASLELEGSEIIARLREGGTVLYGEPVELSAKNRALAELLRWAKGQAIPVGTIDVRAPSAPSLEPVQSRPDPSPTPSP